MKGVNKMEEQIILPKWCEFFDNLEKIKLNYDCFSPQTELTQTQKNTKNYIIDNQHSILNIILNDLFKNFHKIKETYQCDDCNSQDYMPDIEEIETLKYLIHPRSIHILNIEKDNLCYVGFEFNCEWDEEHGYGVMTHKQRIIETGGADTAFLNWIAQKDFKSEQTKSYE